jgi:uncharacterized protein HemX
MEDVVTKGLKTKRVKKDKVLKETPATSTDTVQVTAREKVRKNKKGLVGAAIGAALGIVGTYFYMKKDESPKA